MRRPIPLGFSEELPPPDGTAPYGGSNYPGPLGTGTDPESQSSELNPSGKTETADGFVSPPFQVGSDTYRLRKADREWQPSSHEVEIPPENAGPILEEAIQKNSANESLVRILQSATTQLAGLHEGGTFVLVWMRPHFTEAFVPTPKAAPAPRPAPSPGPPPVEEPMMADAQADTLKEAAALGVPFCEECERLKAAQASA